MGLPPHGVRARLTRADPRRDVARVT
jgi:hypothetical protein